MLIKKEPSNLNIQELQEMEEEQESFGFDEQYERMIKQQIGGMLQDYIVFTQNQSIFSNGSNKQ